MNGMVHQAVLERILYCQPQQRIRIQEQLHLPIGLLIVYHTLVRAVMPPQILLQLL